MIMADKLANITSPVVRSFATTQCPAVNNIEVI
jgi:hypothetical protein